MTMLLTCELDETRRLDDAAARSTIHKAAETRAAVRLLIPYDGIESAVSGRVRAADETTLTLEVDRRDDDLSWDASAVHVTLEVDGESYFFETSMLRGNPDQDGNTLVVYRPARIDRRERRSGVRKLLREAIEVTLLPLRGHGGFVPGTMLNLGAGGMACRISRDHVACVPEGSKVRVVFRIGPERYLFDLICNVTNATPASRLHTVLGLNVIEDDNPPITQARLWAALKGSD